MAEFCRGVALQRLPRASQDIVPFARELGIKYLWIDALCIIQDEDNLLERRQQIKRMGEIYQGASLTLSLAASANDQDSCC